MDLASTIRTTIALQSQVLSGEQSAVYGPTIDRKGFEGAVISVVTGTPSGSPSAVGVVLKLQDKSGEVDWVDVSGSTTTVSGESTPHLHEIDQDLKPLSRYIRAVATPHFTDGSSPKIEVAAVCVLGEPKVLPI
jgi:hypothetical protein